MYYGLILLTTVMFGIQFLLNDKYRRLRGGSDLKISMETSLIGSIGGIIVLFAVKGFELEFTPFTFLMACMNALTATGSAFCGFKALEYVNLSLYSLFSQLGGMVLPFLQGILFYGESITVAKIICFIFIAISMFFTLDKGMKKSGLIYCFMIFLLTGSSGVWTKIFASSAYEKTSAESFTIWKTICILAFAAIWLCLYGKKHHTPGIKPLDVKSVTCSLAKGIVNTLAACILVIALAHVDASVQYPMVSGGTMIVSTILGYFTDRKPGKKEWLSVITAFIGMLALFVIRR